ncbi:hypothetical protein A2716_04315 [candidate division WWE3 bacterium RIFCSPHIGHO2_01_FULL_40_23]|uniref:Glycosyltransferase 2-like domain-containing protein n=1 Tax=candidate division WWE3 bacterium RIFCSPLOWO2_01_FULL_41_18 TaxID=1802625 RepID=A0A1F4VDQ4_UNCKA|nr:MAG: hypothetical protein A2716_04315 [candidate division WWE3 bacterium RIFCSPHIGHO2_01_FULL_40_23]OGC55098.1 MAG: hypothetical protein A3A78_03925 [candidate division WWE3 bacterium RIFCSPLOWO2_01_FULL_41_18]
MSKVQITTVITRYSEPDHIVRDCLNSLKLQRNVKGDVLFLDQKESREIKDWLKTQNTENVRFQYISIEPRSLSYARNQGTKLASGNLVAFSDPDCVLKPNWMEELITTFRKFNASIVGTKITPVWGAETSWYHKSKVIQEFYALLDLSQNYKLVSKVIGASFALDKNKIKSSPYFDEGLGRKEGMFLGGEETDLCKRVVTSGGIVAYTANTQALHKIPKERMNLKWLFKMAYFGGITRAMRGGKVETFTTSYNLRDKAAISLVLPFFAYGYFKTKIKIS